MKLLIVTQKADLNDPILGFFHTWLKEFAKRYEQVSVICLERGAYSLPSNVHVYSLGKESGASKFKKLFTFYYLLITLRKQYDAVFVHMNQEYVLLAGDIWWLMRKKVYLWRNHKEGSLWTKMAGLLAHRTFYTSPKAYVASFKNAILMPAGIDLEHFKPVPIPVEENRILAFGRLSPVKRLEEIIDGLKILEKRGFDYKADIVGDAASEDQSYAERLKEKVRELGLTKRVRILPALSHEKAPELYRQYKLLVNLTLDGSLDKTIFEALASGLKVVVANSFFKSWLPTTWVLEKKAGAKELAENLQSVLPDSHTRNSETQGKISVLLKEHRLQHLMDKLTALINQT